MHRARVGIGASEQLAAVLRGLADPPREEARVAVSERGLELLDAAAVLGERVADRIGVV